MSVAVAVAERSTAWLLNDIAESRGKQELFTRQSPQALKALREAAIIQSAESSNRIEGVTVDPDRLRPLVLGNTKPRDRSELVLVAIRQELGEFRLSDIERACPGVGREWIRSLLSDLKAAGQVECRGKGPGARWHYLGNKGSNG